jgi:Uma2 family endonuclease
VITWLGAYQALHPEARLGDNATVLLDDGNEVQPDALLWREEPGGPRLTDKHYLEGPPQLVVEIAARSASYDLHDKLRAYERNGVREYVVWRVLDGMIDWHRLNQGTYEWVEPDDRGSIESESFPGLRLNIPRMLAGDIAAVLAELSL